MSENRSQRPEDREARGQKPEDRETRGQKPEDRDRGMLWTKPEDISILCRCESDSPPFPGFPIPRAVAVRDFSGAFNDMSESIFFTFRNDPYPSSSQPYVGTVSITITVDNSLPVRENDEFFLLLTTESRSLACLQAWLLRVLESLDSFVVHILKASKKQINRKRKGTVDTRKCTQIRNFG